MAGGSFLWCARIKKIEVLEMECNNESRFTLYTASTGDVV